MKENCLTWRANGSTNLTHTKGTLFFYLNPELLCINRLYPPPVTFMAKPTVEYFRKNKKSSIENITQKILLVL